MKIIKTFWIAGLKIISFFSEGKRESYIEDQTSKSDKPDVGSKMEMKSL